MTEGRSLTSETDDLRRAPRSRQRIDRPPTPASDVRGDRTVAVLAPRTGVPYHAPTSAPVLQLLKALAVYGVTRPKHG